MRAAVSVMDIPRVLSVERELLLLLLLEEVVVAEKAMGLKAAAAPRATATARIIVLNGCARNPRRRVNEGVTDDD